MCEGKAKATAEPLGPWKNSRIPDDEWDMKSWRRPRGSVNKFYSLIKVAVLLALLYSYLFTSQFDSYVGVLGLQAKQRRKHTGKELLKKAMSSRPFGINHVTASAMFSPHWLIVFTDQNSFNSSTGNSKRVHQEYCTDQWLEEAGMAEEYSIFFHGTVSHSVLLRSSLISLSCTYGQSLLIPVNIINLNHSIKSY